MNQKPPLNITRIKRKHYEHENTPKAGSIALPLALMSDDALSWSGNLLGPAHIVIYSNGPDNNNNDASPEIANLAYTNVIVNFINVDTNCQLKDKPYVSPGDMQTLHDDGKKFPGIVRQQFIRGL